MQYLNLLLEMQLKRKLHKGQVNKFIIQYKNTPGVKSKRIKMDWS